MTTLLERPPIATQAMPAPATTSSWLQVLVDLHPKYGGMSAAVPELAAALSAERIAAPLAALCRSEEQFVPPAMPQDSVHFLPRQRGAWMFAAAAKADLDTMVRSAQGVHVHGLWTPATVAAAGSARRLGRPYCVSAHGMLEPWSLQQSRLRKQVYAGLVEHRILRGAACLHALTASEAHSYRQVATRVPVAIVPNGVTVPEELSSQPFLARYPGLRHKRIVLFLGRLHSKKGVDLLLQAWQSTARRFSEAHLVLAGPADDAMTVALQGLVQREGMQQTVTFTGMLGHAMKWSALCAADLFVLPSHSEGFSVAILEALAAGTPVIATPQCNMPQLATEQCGWLTEPNVPALAQTLTSALERSELENRDAGERGRRLVQRDYTWSVIAQKMAEVYRWLEGGSFPVSAEVLP